MRPETLVAGILAATAIVAAWRAARRPLRARLAFALAQPVLALALYFVLFPPIGSRAAASLVVLTPGAVTAQVDALEAGTRIVALPGAPAHPDAEPMPDLGTALRRHPDTGELRIAGYGLPTRDLAAATGIPLRFDPAPLPPGIVDWIAPQVVRPGSVWPVSGHVRGAAGGRVDLVDPGAVVAATGAIDADGAFRLESTARIDGESVLGLRALDAEGTLVDEVPLALVVRAGDAQRVLLLAGNPSPETKYLRRWAVDAGIQLAARIGVSPGIAVREGEPALAAPALRELDLAIVDERAWGSLGHAEKSALTDAVRAGLGLLLIGRSAPSRNVAADWTQLGLAASVTGSAQTVALDRSLGLDPRDRFAFTRVPLALDAHDVTVLGTADDGAPLGWMRPLGQGRVALWSLVDSYRLTLGGRPERFGSLWAQVFEAVGRARSAVPPRLPARARSGERSVVCGIPVDAAIDGDPAIRLAVSADASDIRKRCAAWWPVRAGWHRLAAAGRSWPIHVLGPGEAHAAAAAERHDATRRLADAATTSTARTAVDAPLSRWPFAAAWLALALLLWWWERHWPASRPDEGG